MDTTLGCRTETWVASTEREVVLMSTLDGILGLLNNWPAWKRITEAPERVDALESRVAALEDKLRLAPGEACPKCGALEFRTESEKPHPLMGALGARIRTLKCGACDHSEERVETPE